MVIAKRLLSCPLSKRRKNNEMRALPFWEASQAMRLGANLTQSETRFVRPDALFASRMTLRERFRGVRSLRPGGFCGVRPPSSALLKNS